MNSVRFRFLPAVLGWYKLLKTHLWIAPDRTKQRRRKRTTRYTVKIDTWNPMFTFDKNIADNCQQFPGACFLWIRSSRTAWVYHLPALYRGCTTPRGTKLLRALHITKSERERELEKEEEEEEEEKERVYHPCCMKDTCREKSEREREPWGCVYLSRRFGGTPRFFRRKLLMQNSLRCTGGGGTLPARFS